MGRRSWNIWLGITYRCYTQPLDDVLISGIGERAEPLLSEVIIIQNTLNSMTFDNDEDQGNPDYEIAVSSNIPISGGGSSGIADSVQRGKF